MFNSGYVLGEMAKEIRSSLHFFLDEVGTCLISIILKPRLWEIAFSYCCLFLWLHGLSCHRRIWKFPWQKGYLDRWSSLYKAMGPTLCPVGRRRVQSSIQNSSYLLILLSGVCFLKSHVSNLMSYCNNLQTNKEWSIKSKAFLLRIDNDSKAFFDHESTTSSSISSWNLLSVLPYRHLNVIICSHLIRLTVSGYAYHRNWSRNRFRLLQPHLICLSLCLPLHPIRLMLCLPPPLSSLRFCLPPHLIRRRFCYHRT